MGCCSSSPTEPTKTYPAPSVFLRVYTGDFFEAGTTSKVTATIYAVADLNINVDEGKDQAQEGVVIQAQVTLQDSIFHPRLTSGSVAEYDISDPDIKWIQLVEAKEIGVVRPAQFITFAAIQITMAGGAANDWWVKKMEVVITRVDKTIPPRTILFPVDNWIAHNDCSYKERRRFFTFFNSGTRLSWKFRDLDVVAIAQLQAAQNIFPLSTPGDAEDIIKGIASYPLHYARTPNDIYRGVAFDLQKTVDFISGFAVGAVNTGLGKFRDLFNPWNSIDDLDQVYSVLERPAVSKTWLDDYEFGYQAVAGVNPTRIALLNTNGEVKDNIASPSKGNGLALWKAVDQAVNSLTPAMQKQSKFCTEWSKYKQFYVMDYKEFASEVKAEEDKDNGAFLNWPTCLLGYNEEVKKIRPLAILLNLVGEDSYEIKNIYCCEYMPGSKNEVEMLQKNRAYHFQWLLARSFVANADTQIHQIDVHFLRTHASMEPIALNLYRHLPSYHPVARILIFHMRYTVNINALARGSLVNKGGVIPTIFSIGPNFEKLVSYAETKWDINSGAPDESLKRRGMDQAVCNYPWRNDAQLLWNNIAAYVTAYVNLYYKQDEDVANDAAFQRFRHNLALCYSRGDDAIPQTLNKAQLIRFISTVIWTCSGQHASVNFGQYDFYGYPFNRPSAMMRSPADIPKVTTEKEFMTFMPTPSICAQAMSVTKLLAAYSKDEIYLLGKWGDKCYFEKEALDVFDKFQVDLAATEEQIKLLNKQDKYRQNYHYLLPTKVPTSIAV